MDTTVFASGNDIDGIRAVELIQLHPVIGRKLPAQLLHEYPMAIAGGQRIQTIRKSFRGT